MNLDKRTAWFVDMIVSIGCQSSTEEGGAQVDCDGGEPDHEETEGDTLGVVLDNLQGLHVGLLEV